MVICNTFSSIWTLGLGTVFCVFAHPIRLKSIDNKSVWAYNTSMKNEYSEDKKSSIADFADSIGLILMCALVFIVICL